MSKARWAGRGPCPASLEPAAGARAEREDSSPSGGWLCGSGKATWFEEENVREEVEAYVTVALSMCTAWDSPKDRSRVCEDWLCSEPRFSFPSGFTQDHSGAPNSHGHVSNASGTESCPTTGVGRGRGDGTLLHSVPEGCSWGTAVPLSSVPAVLRGGSGSGLLALAARDFRPAVLQAFSVRTPPPAVATSSPRSPRQAGRAGSPPPARSAGRKPGLRPAQR